jgi:adenylosuccinate synthase
MFCITRAYQTRHGNGFLSNEGIPEGLVINPKETNQENEWQGPLRYGTLDVDLLRYALQSEGNYSAGQKRHLFLTCLDQLQGQLQATLGGKRHTYQTPDLIARLLPGITGIVYQSYSDDGLQVKGATFTAKAIGK